MVLPGLPGRLRWGRFCRISAKTPHGRGAGVCRASLAVTGDCPDQPRVDNSYFFGLTSHPGSLNCFIRLALLVGINLTFIPEHEPWRNGAIEHFNGWLAGTHSDHSLAFSFSGPVRIEGHDGNTRHHEHFIPTAFLNHRPGSKKSVAAYFASQLPSTSGALAHCYWSCDLLACASSGRITILGVKFEFDKCLAHQYVSAILCTRTDVVKIHWHCRRSNSSTSRSSVSPNCKR